MIAIDIPQINYSTITVARRFSVEMPYCDARMGAPFKQKNGPAIAVVGAIGSISAGFAASSALLGGLMIAGGIATGLGAITGNKTLSTIGAVAGLAGFGVGSFTNATTGGFMNPFAEGASFTDTVTGGAFKSVFDNIKSATGIGSASPTANVAGAGESIVDAATPGSIAEEIASGGSSLTSFNGESTSAFGRAVDSVKDVGSSLSGSAGSLFGNQGILGALSGLGGGYTEGKKIEQNQPLIDARVQSENAQTDAQRQQMGILAQRQKNMQYQPNVALEVNQNQQIYSSQPGQGNAGKYAVAVNGTIKYVTQAEYDAMRQQQGATPAQGTA